MFSFDDLPLEPPPEHLTGDRRAISFTAPMTSVQSCSLIVRAHWEVVIRSVAWGTLIATVLMGIVIAITVPLHKR